MPPPGARFNSALAAQKSNAGNGMVIAGDSCLRVFREHLVQSLGRGYYWQFRNLRNQPFHLAGLNFILRDAAGFARSGIDHRGCAALQLPCPPRRYQNVAVVAVEPFNQLHTLSPKTSRTFYYLRVE